MSSYTLLCIDQEDRGEDPCYFLLFNLIISLASAIYYYSLNRRSISGVIMLTEIILASWNVRIEMKSISFWI